MDSWKELDVFPAFMRCLITILLYSIIQLQRAVKVDFSVSRHVAWGLRLLRHRFVTMFLTFPLSVQFFCSKLSSCQTQLGTNNRCDASSHHLALHSMFLWTSLYSSTTIISMNLPCRLEHSLPRVFGICCCLISLLVKQKKRPLED